jgi:superfamily II DNA/RNA helicase
MPNLTIGPDSNVGKAGHTVYATFEEMNLDDNLLRGIYSYGFEKPSTIQSQAIVPILSGKDVIVQSQSGSGKTATFVIPALQKVDMQRKQCQVLILAHTKELARQIHTRASQMGKYLKGLQYALCIGGTDIRVSKKKINSGPSIAIGTPGRVYDMIKKNIIRASNLELVILDEADELLSEGFRQQIKDIISEIPLNSRDEFNSQICILSATMPRSVLNITKHFMDNPISIRVKHEDLTLEGIKQFYVNVDREEYKLETFIELFQKISVGQSIVFVNTKRRADWLQNKLEENNFTISVIHSDLEQREREQVMKQYRNGQTRVLISTDLTCRGIDVQQVSLVINYDLPNDKESYLHRIGRSGRYGRKGTAINFVSNEDSWKIQSLEMFYDTEINVLPQDIVDKL